MENKKEGNFVDKTKTAIISAMDENGNGEIDIEDVILKGIKIPGIRIKRAEFLQKQLFPHYPQEIIDIAIAESPMKANIPLSKINKIADDIIKFERNCVSGISAALSMPGGWAMVATIPADIAQYYGYMLRTIQKLLYLYGFPEINTDEKETHLDDATMNSLIICFGVMNGVSGANTVLKTMAKALGKGVEKQLLNRALTKGTFYPIVKSVAKWFGLKMTKEVFAGFFKKAIPVVGGVLGGGLTYLSFKPCCDQLKKVLQDTILSNPNYKPELEDDLMETSLNNETNDKQNKVIDKETLIHAITKNGNEISFIYENKNCGLSFNVKNGEFYFSLYYGNQVKELGNINIENVLQEPFFDEKSIEELLPIIEITFI